MRPISLSASHTINTALANLHPGESRRLVDPHGSYMDLCVERLTERTAAVAHYGEQNGDLMADPDVELWQGPDDRWYAVNMTQAYLGIYHQFVEFEGQRPVRANIRAQNDAHAFISTWMRNVEVQQGAALARLRRGDYWTGRPEAGAAVVEADVDVDVNAGEAEAEAEAEAIAAFNAWTPNEVPSECESERGPSGLPRLKG